MSIKLWIARDRDPRVTYGKEIAPCEDPFCVYMSPADVDKHQTSDGTVIFYGADFTLSGQEIEEILEKAGLSLSPGEGPVEVEVTIRRTE